MSLYRAHISWYGVCTCYGAIHTSVCVYICHCESIHVTVEHSQVTIWMHVCHDMAVYML